MSSDGQLSVEGEIEKLADAGLLTERQAEAFVLRDVEAMSRQATAEHMGISVNTLDNILGTARRKVEQADATVAALVDVRYQASDVDVDALREQATGRDSLEAVIQMLARRD